MGSGGPFVLQYDLNRLDGQGELQHVCKKGRHVIGNRHDMRISLGGLTTSPLRSVETDWLLILVL